MFLVVFVGCVVDVDDVVVLNPVDDFLSVDTGLATLVVILLFVFVATKLVDFELVVSETFFISSSSDVVVKTKLDSRIL